MSFSHLQFKELIERVAPELTPAESLAVRAVSWHETNYASGWRTPEARASRNLGAITRAPITKLEDGSVICEPPNFAHGDSLRDPKTGKVLQYQTCFAGYETFEDAALDLVREVLKENVRSFANRGSLRGVAKAMRKNRYYLGTAPTEAEQVDAYHSALERAVGDIVERTGEPNPFEAGASVAVWLPSPSQSESPLQSPQLDGFADVIVPQPALAMPMVALSVVLEARARMSRIAENRRRKGRARARASRAVEVSSETREAMQRLSSLYLQNVPPSYLHMAVAMQNLSRFSVEELRAELVRRDEAPAFPDPSQLQEELEQLEEAALAREAEARGIDPDSDEADDLDPFEGEGELPPASGHQLPSTVPDNPKPTEPEKE